jgi:AraC-like DNA-binding protein
MSQERHHAFIGYQTGFASVLLRAWAMHFLKTADTSDSVPTAVRAQADRLVDGIVRLRSLVRRHREPPDRAIELTEKAWQSFQNAWGGERHLAVIRLRGSDPDFDDWNALENQLPWEEATWQNLRESLSRFITGLPRRTAVWVRLGVAVAEILDPRSGDDGATGRIALLENQLSEAMPHPWLDGIPLNLSGWSLADVAELHEKLLQRLSNRHEAADGPSDKLPLKKASRGKETEALVFLMQHPEATDEEIARQVGCSRTSLYRMDNYRKCRAMLKQGKHERRSGRPFRNKAGDGYIDGIEDAATSSEAEG